MEKEKGYDGCFWWGFFLSFIGAILVGLRPNLKENQSQLKCECSNNMEYDDIHNSSSNNNCARITEYSNYSVNKTAESGKLADLFLASKISSEEYKKKSKRLLTTQIYKSIYIKLGRFFTAPFPFLLGQICKPMYLFLYVYSKSVLMISANN